MAQNYFGLVRILRNLLDNGIFFGIITVKEVIMKKTCPYCKLEKDSSEFYKNKNNKDGISYECKLCNNAKRYKNNREKNRREGKKLHITTYEARRLYSEKLKYCHRCGNVKPFSEYHKSKSQKHEIATVCKVCAAEKYELRKIKDKDKKREYYLKYKRKGRDKKLQQKYGITLKEYELMLINQNNCCAICGISKKDNGKDFAVDHCHSSGKVRGLLCNRCNPAIGFLQDSPEIAKNALKYIKKHMT